MKRQVSIGRRAADGVQQILLSDARRPYADDFVDFTMEIHGEGLTARSTVRTIEGAQAFEGETPLPSLSQFLGDLADSWRGWDGVRTWRSIEHDLELAAQVVSGGHVQLAVTLHENYRADAWTATVTAQVEAGAEMHRLATDVELFLRADDGTS